MPYESERELTSILSKFPEDFWSSLPKVKINLSKLLKEEIPIENYTESYTLTTTELKVSNRIYYFTDIYYAPIKNIKNHTYRIATKRSDNLRGAIILHKKSLEALKILNNL